MLSVNSIDRIFVGAALGLYANYLYQAGTTGNMKHLASAAIYGVFAVGIASFNYVENRKREMTEQRAFHDRLVEQAGEINDLIKNGRR